MINKEACIDLENAVERSNLTGKEFCVVCHAEQSYPLSTHIEDPRRFVGGAYYVECSGQVCAECAQKLKSA